MGREAKERRAWEWLESVRYVEGAWIGSGTGTIVFLVDSVGFVVGSFRLNANLDFGFDADRRVSRDCSQDLSCYQVVSAIK